MKNKLKYEQKINEMTIPQKWLATGTQPPTKACKEKTLALIMQLYDDFNLQPGRISPTIVDGIFLKYSNHNAKRELIVEVNNDLGIAALINEDKEILLSRDIEDISKDFGALIELLFA